LEELTSLIGPKYVYFMSQDDKARVPIGLAAENKQFPLLMRLECKISLPDHDWVSTARHKMIHRLRLESRFNQPTNQNDFNKFF
jgi:hypothetical protein